LPTYIHTIITTFDYKWHNKNKLDAKVWVYFDRLLIISALEQGKKRESKSASEKQYTYTGKKVSFKHKTSLQNKTKYIQCLFCNMKGHEEDTWRFKLKSMQQTQRKTKQKAQKKPNEIKLSVCH
jgi:hypothetical protein